MTTSKNLKQVIHTIVPEDIYTNRAEHLEYLHKAALKAASRLSMSTVLLGQRRMGKTEIFKRVVNRLFFEQKHPEDPHNSVVPVYYSFRDEVQSNTTFAIEYTENLLRWITAFRLQQPELALQESLNGTALLDYVKANLPESAGLKEALALLTQFHQKETVLAEKSALWLPRRIADWDNTTMVMFLDEFQNTRLPQHNFSIVGLMQEAVESPRCPHFVTGSAMSILANEILGRGALFGRFESEPIGPMTEYWGAELALKVARACGATLPATMAPVVAARCGGNPFYITAVVRRSERIAQPLQDEAQLNHVLAVDLSSGFIWAELNEQVNRWIDRINEHGITKWVLYLSALEEGERIDLERIQRELYERDRREVSLEMIRDVLIKLSRGDLLEYLELGNWFRKVDDPILLEFLKVWGRIAVEGRAPERVRKEIEQQYQTLKRQISNHLGYVGEVYMAQILWNMQRQHLPGRLLHSPTDIPVPGHFNYIWHRTSLGEASGLELDLEAASGSEMWIGESKWWRGRKAGIKEVRTLLVKARLLRQKEGEGLRTLRLWFFAHDGFTAPAQKLMRAEDVMWSDGQDLNRLLAHAGLKMLPKV